MDIKVTFDISARFEHALNNLADAMAHHPFAGYCDYNDKRAGEPHTPFAELLRGVYPQSTPAEAPEPAAEAEPVVMPPATESANTEAVQLPETAITETPANDDAPAVEPAPEKPKKKKVQKKPVEAPEPSPEPEAPVTQPVPKSAPTEPTAPQEAAKSDGDPMAGMTVVDAVQALVGEIQDKGIDMSSVNARVRAKANEIGLTYASAACLIKAIGYVEARRVALGEK